MSTTDETISFILFQVGGTTYGLPADCVRQMEMIEVVTPVPGAPEFVDGVVFSRGQVVPAVNLRARFGMERAAYGAATRLIVVWSAGRTVGLIVDSAREFASITRGSLQKPPAALVAAGAHFLTGIALLGERLVLILDVDKLLSLTDTSASAAAEARAAEIVDGNAKTR